MTAQVSPTPPLQVTILGVTLRLLTIGAPGLSLSPPTATTVPPASHHTPSRWLTPGTTVVLQTLVAVS